MVGLYQAEKLTCCQYEWHEWIFWIKSVMRWIYTNCFSTNLSHKFHCSHNWVYFMTQLGPDQKLHLSTFSRDAAWLTVSPALCIWLVLLAMAVGEYPFMRTNKHVELNNWNKKSMNILHKTIARLAWQPSSQVADCFAHINKSIKEFVGLIRVRLLAFWPDLMPSSLVMDLPDSSLSCDNYFTIVSLSQFETFLL